MKRVVAISFLVSLSVSVSVHAEEPKEKKIRKAQRIPLKLQAFRAKRFTPYKRNRRAQKKPRTPQSAPKPCSGLEALPRTGKLPFTVGEELAYEFQVSGVYVGRFETKIGEPRIVNGKKVWVLFGRARTNSFVSTFQAFSGRYMALIDPETLEPIGARVESTYGKDPRWENIRFGKDNRTVTADYLYKGKELSRDYDSAHALTDVLTMLFRARTVLLSPGLAGCQDVFGARRLWRMEAEVENLTKVDTPIGDQEAYFVKTAFDRKPHHTLNNKKRPRFELDVYLANNESQTPLAFRVRVKSLEAEGRLVRWSLDDTADSNWAF